MRIIFACGGTGGHINPAVAIAKMLRERRPRCGILFVGSEKGMETKLVPREGFELKTISNRSFRHKLTPPALWWNIKTAAGMVSVLKQAKKIIREFKPDIVVGTGGYASFPIVYQAARMGIPSAIHESNAVPGWSTKALSGVAQKIMVSFEQSIAYYKNKDRVVVTGTPVREDFIFGKKEEARRALNLDDRPFVVVTFGSLGAREMNKMMADFIVCLSKSAEFQLLYSTGRFGASWVPGLLKEKGVDLTLAPFINMVDYVYDMPTAMTAADLTITRSGASTLSELMVSATPAILVPSPNVTGNHQEKNARALEKEGAAEVIIESRCNGQLLYNRTLALIKDMDRLEKMTEAMRKMAYLNANELIYSTITDMV